MTTLKPGTIIKEKGFKDHYTVVDGGKVFSHKANAVLDYVRASDFERWIKQGHAEIVHPEPEKPREVKAGDIISWGGSIYTITSDDKFFSHQTNKVVELMNYPSALGYCAGHKGAWTFLN